MSAKVGLAIVIAFALLALWIGLAHAGCTYIIDQATGQMTTICCTGNVCQVIR